MSADPPSSYGTDGDAGAPPISESSTDVFLHFPANDTGNPTNISSDTIQAIPFDALCLPSESCLQECQNTSRLFEANSDDYIEYDGMKITLFETCTNLGYLYSDYLLQANGSIGESLDPQTIERDEQLSQLSAGIGGCLASSCDITRKPYECKQACNLSAIYTGGFETHREAAWKCLDVLCSNTCGLPYANGDVMGIGILASYIMQAGIAILCAFMLASRISGFSGYISRLYARIRRQLTNSTSKERETLVTDDNHTPTRGGSSFAHTTELFLVTQCFFGLTLQIAVLSNNPLDVDPLNGFAFVLVATIGFLPQSFTLFLLYVQRQRHDIQGPQPQEENKISIFTWTLTLLCWALATSTFWMLFHNLRSQAAVDHITTQTLGTVHGKPPSTCGGHTSAFSLCPSTTDQNPLKYVWRFYNDKGILNIHRTPVLWAWSTFILAAVAAASYLHHRSRCPRFVRSIAASLHGNFVFTITTFLYLVAFGLQAEIIVKYVNMDVINGKQWGFGQVVAVLLWLPVLADYLHNSRRMRRISDRALASSSKISGKLLSLLCGKEATKPSVIDRGYTAVRKG